MNAKLLFQEQGNKFYPVLYQAEHCFSHLTQCSKLLF